MDFLPWLFLGVSLFGAALTCNAYRPFYYPPQLAMLSFFAGWLTAELPFHTIVFQLIGLLVFSALGALEQWPGMLGLAITGVSWLGLVGLHSRSLRAEAAVEEGLRSALGPGYRRSILPEAWSSTVPPLDWKQLALPFVMRHPDVERTRDIAFCTEEGYCLNLDVYRHRARPRNRPMLLQIHGGAWMVGTKNEQGLPLMLQMASCGWVCVSADYRLSPIATFPEHLIDVKRALTWMREHAAEFGGDPNFIVVTGGSAGGHLAAMTALTANDPEYQPGFEAADTSVQACVPFYGVYDFTNAEELREARGLADLLERRVLKQKLTDARELYERSSPVLRVHPQVPPFLVVHGTRDSLVPIRMARTFVATLRKLSSNPVVFLEIPGAQHAFEIFRSVRTSFVVHGTERFLAWAYSRYLSAKRGDSAEAA